MLLRMCCIHGYSELLEFLIMDFKISRNNKINKYLESSEAKYAVDLFYQRDVIEKIETIKTELDIELNPQEELKTKKLKV